jgi:hypothetical protein
MFDISSPQGNANQNYIECPSQSSKNDYHQQKQKANIEEMWEKRDLILCGWECKSMQPLWKSVLRFFKKLKLEQTRDQALPMLGVDLKDSKSAYY